MTALKLPILHYLQSPNYSSRKGHKVDLIVIHDCQGGYAGSIETFKGSNNGNPVSAHYVLKEDGSEATQMVDIAQKAWHGCDFNGRSVGIEMAGFEAKGYAPSEWSAAEAMTAYLCHKLGIAPVWAKGGSGPGICRHYDLGKAGGGHSDPTLDTALWEAFITKVKVLYDAGGAPTTWAPVNTVHKVA